MEIGQHISSKSSQTMTTGENRRNGIMVANETLQNGDSHRFAETKNFENGYS